MNYIGPLISVSPVFLGVTSADLARVSILCQRIGANCNLYPSTKGILPNHPQTANSRKTAPRPSQRARENVLRGGVEAQRVERNPAERNHQKQDDPQNSDRLLIAPGSQGQDQEKKRINGTRVP